MNEGKMSLALNKVKKFNKMRAQKMFFCLPGVKLIPLSGGFIVGGEGVICRRAVLNDRLYDARI